MIRKIVIVLIMGVVLCNNQVFGQQISDYLITENIGDYIASKNPSSGKGPGIVVEANHFYQDHADMTYEIDCFNLQTRVGPEVQITKHSGSDSDKWLLHEIERDFRNYYGTPGITYGPRMVNGQTILEDTVGGAVYRWVSGTKVINIQYVDLEMTKPEPIEVVLAYLSKHPSTLPTVTLQELRSTANKTTWIKDEMDRRLWLCDKWFLQLTLKKAEEKQVYNESVKSMNILLDFREKYYGLKAADEKNLLASYLNTSNGIGVKAKLAEYKNWWAANKDK